MAELLDGERLLSWFSRKIESKCPSTGVQYGGAVIWCPCTVRSKPDFPWKKSSIETELFRESGTRPSIVVSLPLMSLIEWKIESFMINLSMSFWKGNEFSRLKEEVKILLSSAKRLKFSLFGIILSFFSDSVVYFVFFCCILVYTKAL